MIMLDNTVVNVALPSIQTTSASSLRARVGGERLRAHLRRAAADRRQARRPVRPAPLHHRPSCSRRLAGLRARDEHRRADRVRASSRASARRCHEPGDPLDHHGHVPAAAARVAIGIWVGVSAMAPAIGPLVGGFLTEQIDWSWIFFINVPSVSSRSSRATRDRRVARPVEEQRLDLPGPSRPRRPVRAHLRPDRGEQLRLDVGPGSSQLRGRAVAAGRFVLLEQHQRVPMLDLSLFKNRAFAGANTVMLLVALAMFGVFFFNSLYLQNILGYSPTQAGAAFLPMTILIVSLRPLAGWSPTGSARGLRRRRDARARASLLSFPGSASLDLLGPPPGAAPRRHRHVAAMTPTPRPRWRRPVDKAGVG